jgi:hypothetical protein
MPKARDIGEDDHRRLWCMKTFKERGNLLRERFGETNPLGNVISIVWDDLCH